MVKLKVIIRQSKKFLRRIACASTAAVLLSASLTGCSASASSINKDSGSSGEALASDKSPALDNDSPLTMEGAGFDSPEAAAMGYLEGLRDADFKRMMSAFAIESYVENYNFEALLNMRRAYMYALEIKLPNTNEFVKAMNLENRRGSVADKLLRQYLFLCVPELDQSQPQKMGDETEVSSFVAQLNKGLNAPKLQTLEVLGFIPPEDLAAPYASEQNKQNLAQLAEVCGADQQVSLVAVFELNEDKYMLCLDIVDYDGKWYISQPGGNIGALMGIASLAMGMMPLPAEYYDEIHTLIVPAE